jgi:predicted O-methyltransferase YrrM
VGLVERLAGRARSDPSESDSLAASPSPLADLRRRQLARENFKNAGFESRVTQVLGDAHEEIKKLKGPVDLVFIDADKPGYADYLRKLMPIVRPGGLILAHNTISSGKDMKEFLDLIKTHPDLETTFINATDRGMSISMKKR